MHGLPTFLISSILIVAPSYASETNALLPEIENLKAEISALQSNIEAQLINSNHIWTMICAALVLFMQVGFLFLEAGAVRSKNSINVAQKNIADFFISVSVFYLIGFAVMFGPSILGWFGSPSTLSAFNVIDDWSFTFFVFQAVFVGTAATLMSGAIAERMNLVGYMVMSAVIAALIYPVFGHWAWGNLLDGDNAAWLADKGFIDFAGSTVVHSVGAWVALAGIIVLGPRIGRFGEDGKAKTIQGHSAVLTTAGAVILLIGWMGFNGGSTTTGTPDFAKIIANTILAAAFAGIIAMTIGRLYDGLYGPKRSVNGMLAGLVGITAGCAAVDPYGAIAIGSICGVVIYYAEEFILHKCKLDDVVGAVAVHGVCGALGTLLVAFFASPEHLAAGSVFAQLQVQALGVGAAFAWTFPLSYITFKIVDMIFGLRVSEEDELRGLNIAEHGATLGTGELQERLQRITTIDRDLTIRLDETSGDETAEIAAIVNPFLDDVHDLMRQLKTQSIQVAHSASTLTDLSKTSVESANEASAGSAAMSKSASDLSTNTQHLDGVAREISSETLEAMDATEIMAKEIHVVSDAISELAQSVASVGSDATVANDFATKTAAAASTAHEAVNELAGASNDISTIIDMISDVAAQTNLLALNATIEASRAGDAGRGFAVVASEVKTLSEQTTKATEEIRARVKQIQSDSANATGIMGELHEIATKMGSAMNNIHAATQQQTTIADSISTNSQTAANNVDMISDKINTVTNKVGDVSKEITSISDGATLTGEHASSLSQVVELTRERAKSMNDNAQSLAEVSSSLNASAQKYKI